MNAWLSATHVPLGFWPFGSGLMLLWGLAAALPIIIHLWNRRKYREAPWAAMEYLLAAVRKNARRIRLEQWLLLAVRALILLLLALALADPLLSVLPSLGSRLGAAARTHYLLVLDGSYSMDYRQGDARRFDEARALAAQVVQQSTQGDGFTLILMADPPQVIIGDPAFAPQDVLDELEGLEVPHTGAKLSATLAEAENILRDAARRQPELAQTRVCFFTDLGATTWNEVITDECRERIGRLAERASLTLVPVDLPSDQNLALTRLTAGDSLRTVGAPLQIQAEIQNWGRRDVDQAEVRFFADEQQIHREALRIPAGGRASVAFSHRFETPGEHYLEARLDDDPLPIDNHRWLSVPVRESLRVLCIAGKLQAARHVAYALQPVDTDRAAIRPQIRPESALLEEDLHEYDCLFLCNVGRLGRDEAAVLRDYVENGGGLIVMLGDQVQAENYNRELVDDPQRRVLPARLGELVDGSQYVFDPLAYRHPIVQPFRDHERTGLLTTPVWTYMRLEPVEGGTAKVALGFNTGDAAVMEEQIGRGRSILLATAGSPASINSRRTPPTPWTALATWPSFVPLVQEMLRLAVSDRDAYRNVRVGEPLAGVVHGQVGELPLRISPPDWPRQPVAGGPPQRIQLEVSGNDSRWTYGETEHSGMFRAQYGDPLNAVRWYGVNVDPREGSLEQLDPELLPSQFNQTSGEDTEAGAVVPGARAGSLFRSLLGGVLLLVVLETFLGWRFGTAAA